MKIYTSYFNQLRNFTEEMIPLSTAKWDPKWFHQNKGNKFKFIDKNKVVNGLRLEPFVFNEQMWNKLVSSNQECSKDCDRQGNCMFMELYQQQLESINIEDVNKLFEGLCETNNSRLTDKDKKSCIVLLVHEPSTCKCAERPVIQEYFRKHGIAVQEWRKDIWIE